MNKRLMSGCLLVAMTLFLVACSSEGEENTAVQSATPTPKATFTPTPTPTFNFGLYSLDDPQSLWVVVNKLRPFNPSDFVPGDLSEVQGVPNEFSQPLREPAARAVEKMFVDAAASGISFGINSAYRDYSTQVSVYNRYVSNSGQQQADTFSARPGHSEHQSGLAVDLDNGPACYLNECFEQTPAGIWLTDNSYRYGFILRYPEGKEAITGYRYEPWHFRYVGVELATEMRNKGITTLEEFFGMPAAPTY